LARHIRKEFDANKCSFGRLVLIMSLHYLVQCRNRILAIYNNEFILDSACLGSKMIN